MSKSEIAQKIRAAALLDLEIKAKQTELNELKSEIKPLLAAGDTYLGEAGARVLVKPLNTFNAARAQVDYGDVAEATEPKVTAASLKAYLQVRYPKKWQQKLDEFYTHSTSLTFGIEL